jgi:hypothetical protein
MTSKRVWSVAEVRSWFAGRMPDAWFAQAPEVTADRDEILVVGELEAPAAAADLSGDEAEVAHRSRISGFREDTRDHRMKIASEAEVLWGRKVSWGARCGEVEELFTTHSAPVMTRLRLQERAVLDTLIDAGVARSRSEALAWCVRLVGRNEADWIAGLRSAFEQVEEVRAQGPKADTAGG